jgi:triosephosphate isomerase
MQDDRQYTAAALQQRLVIANWKAKGNTSLLRQTVRALADAAADDESLNAKKNRASFILCPPFPYIGLAAAYATDKTDSFSVGAQDIDIPLSGISGQTGDVIGAVLYDSGSRYVIIGHSDRRKNTGEGDDLIGAKLQAAAQSGLIPILCVGEGADVRAKGPDAVFDMLDRQMNVLLDLSVPCIVAYEPIWAIGTGVVAAPDQIKDIISHLRFWMQEHLAHLKEWRMVYGGSVVPASAPDILSVEGVDGVLVGGASLIASDIVAIYKAACQI